MNRKEKLRHISNIELLNEVENRVKNEMITRRNLLKLANINWCLECQGNNKIEENGYCQNCNNDQVRIEN